MSHLVDLLDDLANNLVEVGHHGDEVFFAGGLTFGRLVGVVSTGTIADIVRSRNEGIVNEDGGIIDEEGLVLIAVDEVTNEVRHDIGSVFFMVIFLGEELPVLLERWTPESFPSSFASLLCGHLPEAVFIEARFNRARGILTSLGFVIEPVELPLARDGRFVACVFQKMPEGLLLRIEVTEVSVVPEVVLPGHNLNPGSRADGRGVTMIEANAFGSEGVDVRRFVIFGTIAAETFPAHIVRHDEDDVGLLCRQRGYEEKESEENFHAAWLRERVNRKEAGARSF